MFVKSEIHDNSDYLVALLILGTHGIKGNVKIKSFTENPETIFSLSLYNENNQSVSLNKLGN